MTRLIVNNFRSKTGSTIDFKDTYGVIKACKSTIDEDVTIPSGTNGVTAGTVTVSSGKTVTIQGDWRII